MRRGTYSNSFSITGSHGIADLNPNAYSPGPNGGAIWCSVASGAVTLSGPIAIAGNGINTEITAYSSSSTITLSGGISGGGNLVLAGGNTPFSGSNTFVISGNNTYGGSTLLLGSASNVLFQLAENNAFPITTTVTLEGDYAGKTYQSWLDLNGNNQELAGLIAASTSLWTSGTSGDNRVINSNTGITPTLTVTPSSTDIFTGTLGGGTSNNSFNLTMVGTGTLVLTGANTYSGMTTISSGTLQNGNGGTLYSGSGNSLGASSVMVGSNGTLVLDFPRPVVTIVSNSISGTGLIEQAGAGIATLSGETLLPAQRWLRLASCN